MPDTAPGDSRAVQRSRAIGAAVLATLLTTAVPGRLTAQIANQAVHTFVLLDQLEQRAVSGTHLLGWDLVGWVGGDYDRLWFKSSGAHATRGGSESEIQLLGGRMVAPFWDLQVGLQFETRTGDGTTRSRASAVVAMEGLAPYWFELEPSLYVSQRGDVSGELTGSLDLFVTQRIVAQPRVDLRVALQDVPDFGIGAGLNDAAVGFRLRYEFRREFAPYIGVRWTRAFAGTASLARAAGDATTRSSVLAGLRLWW